MVWAAAGNLPEQNKSNECVNRPPETAVKKYAGTYDLPYTLRGGVQSGERVICRKGLKDAETL